MIGDGRACDRHDADCQREADDVVVVGCSEKDFKMNTL
jgi:hypothetical protein